jgi:hypothetical protein
LTRTRRYGETSARNRYLNVVQDERREAAMFDHQRPAAGKGGA